MIHKYFDTVEWYAVATYTYVSWYFVYSSSCSGFRCRHAGGEEGKGGREGGRERGRERGREGGRGRGRERRERERVRE